MRSLNFAEFPCTRQIKSSLLYMCIKWVTFLFQACSAARRECEIPFTGRCDRLHPSESFVWRRGQVSESCMDSLSVSVYKCPASCSCIQLSPSLFISLKFVQDCHQLSEFQEFFFLFLEKSILICYRYLLYRIYISNCT